jgi:hypothetical protein
MADEGYHPHKIKYLYVHGHDAPSLKLDITAELPTKIEAILCHKSQFEDPEKAKARWLDTWGEQQADGSLRYFEALQREFGADCEVLTVTDKAGRPLSSVVSFYFRDEVLPYYAGDDIAARDLAANDFKYWELMRRACERGVKIFDYGRSKRDTGPYSFKKNWGFEPQPLHYEYCLYKRATIPEQPGEPEVPGVHRCGGSCAAGGQHSRAFHRTPG